MLSREDLDKLVEPNPEFAQLVKDNPFPPIPWQDIPKFREASDLGNKTITELLGETPEGLEELVEDVPLRDGAKGQVRIVKPSKSSGGPLIFLVHGGGFVVGDSLQNVPPARPLALLYGAVVVSATYRLAPEHPFPTAPLDAYDALIWASKNAESLGADPSKGFILGGTSAGGNISAVLAQLAADNGLQPKLTGLWQSITCIMDELIVPEKYKEHWISRTQDGPRDAIILSNNDIKVVYDYYKPDVRSHLFSPFNSKTAFKGIPPTFFQVCGGDPLRDDTYLFEDALKEKGIKTKLIVYPGLPHGFWNIFPDLKVSEEFRIDLTRGMGWLLGVEVTDKEIAEAHKFRVVWGAG